MALLRGRGASKFMWNPFISFMEGSATLWGSFMLNWSMVLERYPRAQRRFA
jgi:hypothetical protein